MLSPNELLKKPQRHHRSEESPGTCQCVMTELVENASDKWFPIRVDAIADPNNQSGTYQDDYSITSLQAGRDAWRAHFYGRTGPSRPDGMPISEKKRDEEGILYADIDVAKCVEPKRFHDVAGYYSRFELFRSSVNRRHRDPAAFVHIPEPRAQENDTCPQAPPDEIRAQESKRSHNIRT